MNHKLYNDDVGVISSKESYYSIPITEESISSREIQIVTKDVVKI
jgi:hypothetical protein